jgi:hypothetical protein
MSSLWGQPLSLRLPEVLHTTLRTQGFFLPAFSFAILFLYNCNANLSIYWGFGEWRFEVANFA